jgi:hypothetical protein
VIKESTSSSSPPTRKPSLPPCYGHRREVGGQRRGHVRRPRGPREARGHTPRPRDGQASRHAACGSARTCRPLPPRTLPACPDVVFPLPEDRPRSAAATPAMRFPPSVFPLWEPPFQISPFQKRTPPKGANRRGPPHGGLHGKRRENRLRAVFFMAPFSAAALRWPRPAAAQSAPLR